MSDRKTTPAFGELPFKELSEQWVSACFLPWNTLQDWNVFWGDQWKDWMKQVASAPNPWLGPLAGGRTDQRAEIDFFLPWLPRVESVFTSDSASPDKALMSAMVRAALLPLQSMSPMTVEHEAAETAPPAPRAQTVTPKDSVPVASKPVRKVAQPKKAAASKAPGAAARKPAKLEVVEANEAVAKSAEASKPVVDIASQLQAANAAVAAKGAAARKPSPKAEAAVKAPEPAATPKVAAPTKAAARKRTPAKPKPASKPEA